MAEPQVLAKIDPGRRKSRDHHHRIAFLRATGKRVGEIADLTGMSIQRVSNLNREPEFQKLVELYTEKTIQIEVDAYKRTVNVMTGILGLTVEELRDRLEECPELLSVKDLVEIFKEISDRLGMGKVQSKESVSVNIDLAGSVGEVRRRKEAYHRTLQLSASPSRDAATGPSPISRDGPVQNGSDGPGVIHADNSSSSNGHSASRRERRWDASKG